MGHELSPLKIEGQSIVDKEHNYLSIFQEQLNPPEEQAF
jgi:hypothetical protein